MHDASPFQAAPSAPLVDGQGKPLAAAVPVLTSQIAGPTLAGVRNVWSNHPAQGLNPARLAELLRDAEQGDATAYLELAEEMEEKYPHYAGVLGVRKRAVSQLPVRVEAAGESPEEEGDAQILRDWLKRLTLQAELIDILDALGKAYSATEIIWELGELWLPSQLIWRDPRFFEYDRLGETLLLRGGEGGGESASCPLRPCKFIVHEGKAKSGQAIRGGLARTVAWYYLFANFTLKDWMTFLEVYGLPLRVGKYQNGTSESDIDMLARAVAQIGSDAGAVIPQSMLIEFINGQGGQANPDMFRGMLTYIDDAVSKVVLGQTSSSDAKAGGLGSGQADLHGEVRDDIADADAAQLSATLTRDLAVPIVMFNRGVRRAYPRIIIGRPDKVDVDQFMAAAERGVKLGVPVAVSTWRERTGIPEPKPGEPLLTMAQGTADPDAEMGAQEGDGGPDAPSARGKASNGLLAPLKSPLRGNEGAHREGGSDVPAALNDPTPERAPDAMDRMVEEALDDWGAMMAGMMTPIDDLVAGAASLEEVRELLAVGAGDVIAAMDIDAIAAMAERLGFAGRIAGLIEKPGR